MKFSKKISYLCYCYKILLGINSLKAIGRMHCMKTWKTWFFIPNSQSFQLLTYLPRLEIHLLENFNIFANRTILPLIAYLINNLLLDISYWLDLYSISTFYIFPLNLSIIVYLVFPLTSITILKIISKIFFSMCITSKLWRNMFDDPYGKSPIICLFTLNNVFPT